MVIIDTLLPEDPDIADFYQSMEKMRDPTHIQAHTESEWVSMVEEALFEVQATVVFPKTHDFVEWGKRAGLKRDQMKDLNQFLIDAPNAVHDYFQIETFAGEVESYTDRKLLIFATRSDKK
jgi:hypothetical protein